MPRWLADTVTRRLGVEQLTIDTSHSPFLSRPRELAELLVHATTTKPTGPLIPTSAPAQPDISVATRRQFTPKPTFGRQFWVSPGR